MILVEIKPGIWLELDRNHYLWPKLQLIATYDTVGASTGRITNETLTTLARHEALSRETRFHIAAWGWSVLRPVLQGLGEEING